MTAEKRPCVAAAGRIVALEAEIGDPVRLGQLLVALDDRLVRARVSKLEAQLERAHTQLEWARKDLERQEQLKNGRRIEESGKENEQPLLTDLTIIIHF